jgi:hypothetical protein
MRRCGSFGSCDLAASGRCDPRLIGAQGATGALYLVAHSGSLVLLLSDVEICCSYPAHPIVCRRELMHFDVRRAVYYLEFAALVAGRLILSQFISVCFALEAICKLE